MPAAAASPGISVTQHPPASDAELARRLTLTDEQIAELDPAQRLALSAAMSVAYARGLLGGDKSAKGVYADPPQTRDELLDAIEGLTGYHLPRVAVCVEHGHKAPADTFCELYFEEVHNLLWIGNRGGGKTTNSGFLHGAKNRWLPQYSSAIAGAVEKQGYRAYSEFQRFTRALGMEIIKSIQSRTEWHNGSLTEVLGGTIKQLNGPHPHLAQFDEVELTLWAIFEEFLNMAQADRRYASQQLLTSTRKQAHGIVQGIVKQHDEAVRQGHDPPWEVHIFCVFETLAPVPNCRSAPENAGRPDEELCACHKAVKGKWDDGTDRTFETVCRGRAFKSDGFVQLPDALKRFRTLSRATWEAQQECLKPDIEGLVHKWIRPKHRLPGWLPFPQLGPIYRGWDWGGRNPHAVVWVQRMSQPLGMAWQEFETVDGERFEQLTPIVKKGDERDPFMIIPEGALVQFDELYGNREQLGEFSTLGLHAALRVVYWQRLGFPMDVEGDFCDPAGLVAKNEVKKATRRMVEELGSNQVGSEISQLIKDHALTYEDLTARDIRVPEFQSRPAPVRESVGKVIEMGEDDMVYVVSSMCPGTDDEYDVYHWPTKPAAGTERTAKENPVEEDDHAMDAFRYLIWNLWRATQPGDKGLPAADPTRGAAPARAGDGGGPFRAPTVGVQAAPPGVGADDPYRGAPAGASTSMRASGRRLPSARRAR